jgi:hypothetical protein
VKGIISDMGWRGKLERLEVDPIVMQLSVVDKEIWNASLIIIKLTSGSY